MIWGCLLMILFACNSDNISITIVSSRADNIAEKSEVIYKGVVVGHVKNIEFNNNKVHLAIDLKPNTRIRQDSPVLLTRKNMFETAIEFIDSVHNSPFIANGEVINVDLSYRRIGQEKLDSINKDVIQIIMEELNIDTLTE